jgi:hypothetical protein
MQKNAFLPKALRMTGKAARKDRTNLARWHPYRRICTRAGQLLPVALSREIQPVHADEGVREASRIKALKDSNADLPYAKMTDFGRHDKAAEYRQTAAFR